MTQNIKALFEQVENKKEVVMYLSGHFKLRPSSVRSNWFSNYYAVPEKYQKEVVTILQKFVKKEYQEL